MVTQLSYIAFSSYFGNACNPLRKTNFYPLTENQLLFASKKFLQDSQEPSHREDISLRTSNKRIRPTDVNLHSGLLRCNFTLGFGV